MNTSSDSQLPFDKKVNLKILYTFDDINTFLARSPKPVIAKIITLPSQLSNNSNTQIGCIKLKKCLDLLRSVSPEKFQQDMDYSIYYKDIIELGEPYVGSGLSSKILNDKKSSILITGRLCTNVINLYQGNNSLDTLDIKLRLSSIEQFSSNKRSRDKDLFTNFNENGIENENSNSSPFLNSDDLLNDNQILSHKNLIQSQQKRKIRKSSLNSNINSGNSNNTLNINSDNNLNLINNLPQLASRTQSLPFATEDSLANRIRISDMISSKINEEKEIDANGEPISSRFSNFQKLNFKSNNIYEQPTKAKKSISFIESVVKIGNNTINKKKISNSNLSVKRCINCSSTSNPPYKFYKDGIFELGNSGFLCSICNLHQIKGDIFSLRQRGELGLKGLLEGPYSNQNNSSSNSTIKSQNSKRVKKSKNNNSNFSSNPNSSIIDNSSSPLFVSSSSPLNLQNGFISKSKKQYIKNNYKEIQPIHEIEMFSNNDLNDLLTLDTNFPNYNQNHNTNENNMVSNQINVRNNNNNNNNHSHNNNINNVLSSNSSTTTPSSSSGKGQSKDNTPLKGNNQSKGNNNNNNNNNNNSNNNNNYYVDLDNIPLDATKLNTTLIPMDDDDKENCQPNNIMPPPINVFNSNKDELNESSKQLNEFLGTEFSPSIRRIIESFSNEPSSPIKTTNNEWNYDFFKDDLKNDTHDNMEIEDPEIRKILNLNHKSNIENDNINDNNSSNNGDNGSSNEENKYDITPRDPETGQTQQNTESPTNAFLTPIVGTTDNMQLLSSSHLENSSESVKNKTKQANLGMNSTKSVSKAIEAKKLLEHCGSNNNKTKKNRLNMPSSPFFNIHNDVYNENGGSEEKSLDTTTTLSMIQWDTKSSPNTDLPSSNNDDKHL